MPKEAVSEAKLRAVFLAQYRVKLYRDTSYKNEGSATVDFMSLKDQIKLLVAPLSAELSSLFLEINSLPRANPNRYKESITLFLKIYKELIKFEEQNPQNSVVTRQIKFADLFKNDPKIKELFGEIKEIKKAELKRLGFSREDEPLLALDDKWWANPHKLELLKELGDSFKTKEAVAVWNTTHLNDVSDLLIRKLKTMAFSENLDFVELAKEQYQQENPEAEPRNPRVMFANQNCENDGPGTVSFEEIMKELFITDSDLCVVGNQEMDPSKLIEQFEAAKDKNPNKFACYQLKQGSLMRTVTKGFSKNKSGIMSFVIYDKNKVEAPTFEASHQEIRRIQSTGRTHASSLNKGGVQDVLTVKQKTGSAYTIATTSFHLDSNSQKLRETDWYLLRKERSFQCSSFSEMVKHIPTCSASFGDANIRNEFNRQTLTSTSPWQNQEGAVHGEVEAMVMAPMGRELTSYPSTYNASTADAYTESKKRPGYAEYGALGVIGTSNNTDSENNHTQIAESDTLYKTARRVVGEEKGSKRNHSVVISSPIKLKAQVSDFEKAKHYLVNELENAAPDLAKEISELQNLLKQGTSETEEEQLLVKVQNLFLSRYGLINRTILSKRWLPDSQEGKPWFAGIKLDDVRSMVVVANRKESKEDDYKLQMREVFTPMLKEQDPGLESLIQSPGMEQLKRKIVSFETRDHLGPILDLIKQKFPLESRVTASSLLRGEALTQLNPVIRESYNRLLQGVTVEKLLEIQKKLIIQKRFLTRDDPNRQIINELIEKIKNPLLTIDALGKVKKPLVEALNLQAEKEKKLEENDDLQLSKGLLSAIDQVHLDKVSHLLERETLRFLNNLPENYLTKSNLEVIADHIKKHNGAFSRDAQYGVLCETQLEKLKRQLVDKPEKDQDYPQGFFISFGNDYLASQKRSADLRSPLEKKNLSDYKTLLETLPPFWAQERFLLKLQKLDLVREKEVVLQYAKKLNFPDELDDDLLNEISNFKSTLPQQFSELKLELDDLRGGQIYKKHQELCNKVESRKKELTEQGIENKLSDSELLSLDERFFREEHTKVLQLVLPYLAKQPLNLRIQEISKLNLIMNSCFPLTPLFIKELQNENTKAEVKDLVASMNTVASKEPHKSYYEKLNQLPDKWRHPKYQDVVSALIYTPEVFKEGKDAQTSPEDALETIKLKLYLQAKNRTYDAEAFKQGNCMNLKGKFDDELHARRVVLSLTLNTYFNAREVLSLPESIFKNEELLAHFNERAIESYKLSEKDKQDPSLRGQSLYEATLVAMYQRKYKELRGKIVHADPSYNTVSKVLAHAKEPRRWGTTNHTLKAIQELGWVNGTGSPLTSGPLGELHSVRDFCITSSPEAELPSAPPGDDNNSLVDTFDLPVAIPISEGNIVENGDSPPVVATLVSEDISKGNIGSSQVVEAQSHHVQSGDGSEDIAILLKQFTDAYEQQFSQKMFTSSWVPSSVYKFTTMQEVAKHALAPRGFGQRNNTLHALIDLRWLNDKNTLGDKAPKRFAEKFETAKDELKNDSQNSSSGMFGFRSQ